MNISTCTNLPPGQNSQHLQWIRIGSLITLIATVLSTSISHSAPFTGTILDEDTDEPIPARIYLRAATGEWRFVTSATPEGSALPYREQWVPTEGSEEKHTTVSAHPFEIDLEPGRYFLTIERGKEYLPLTETLEIGDQPVRKTFRLKRWINLAERGWYSGETHVHRRIRELPNVMLAEDLNVAFPVTYWTTDAFAAPDLRPSRLRRQGPSPFGPRKDPGPERIAVDSSHVIFPRNTEYEVFFIDGKRHTLGALFILNHRSVFQSGMPPVAAIAKQAHEEGALLDLDKHSWPWAMMLVPVAKVDLFELSNNSVWRTQFGFRNSGVKLPAWMNVEKDDERGGLTEWGWLNFGWENWYTLLNCGFRLQPTAGTASGVHPVPLGHSRVYVHTGPEFVADHWIDGLRKGRSFVTTGPVLFATLDQQKPGHVFEAANPGGRKLSIRSFSDRPIDRIEVIVNGKVRETFRPGPQHPQVKGAEGGWRLSIDRDISIETSSWIAIRSVQLVEDDRKRFAHTSPWHIEIPGNPLHPRKEETDFLIGRVRSEIERNRGVLPKEALDEFFEALRVYEEIATKAERARAVAGQ